MNPIKHKVERAARKGAALSVATVMGLVGLGFLTAALWMVLSAWRSDLFATVVVGMIFCGLSAVIAAFALRKDTSEPEPTLSPLQLLVVSFIDGFEQARRVKD